MRGTQNEGRKINRGTRVRPGISKLTVDNGTMAEMVSQKQCGHHYRGWSRVRVGSQRKEVPQMKHFASAGRTKSPCGFCTERSVGCHATCEQYAEFQKVHIAEVQTIRKNKAEHLQTFWTHDHKKYAQEYKGTVWKQSKK